MASPRISFSFGKPIGRLAIGHGLGGIARAAHPVGRAADRERRARWRRQTPRSPRYPSRRAPARRRAPATGRGGFPSAASIGPAARPRRRAVTRPVSSAPSMSAGGWRSPSSSHAIGSPLSCTEPGKTVCAPLPPAPVRSSTSRAALASVRSLTGSSNAIAALVPRRETPRGRASARAARGAAEAHGRRQKLRRERERLGAVEIDVGQVVGRRAENDADVERAAVEILRRGLLGQPQLLPVLDHRPLLPERHWHRRPAALQDIRARPAA